MDPPPQCSGYIWLIGVFVIFFSFGLIRCSLVSNLGMPYRTVGAQHLISKPRGAFPICRRLGSNAQWRTIRIAACAQWARTAGPDWRQQMGNVQNAAARDVLRRPLHDDLEGRRELGQAAQ